MLGHQTQPMSTFALLETAKRLLSTDTVLIMHDNVVICRRFNDAGQFEAVQFSPLGNVTRGLWAPDSEWQYPTDIVGGEPGTFTPID